MTLAAYDAFNTWSILGQNIRKQHIRMADEIMNVLARYDAAAPNALPPLADLLEVIGNDIRKFQSDLVNNTTDEERFASTWNVR